MKLRTTIQIISWFIAILTILLFIYTIVNYSFLEKQLTGSVKSGGYIIIFIFSFFLESLPQALSPDVLLVSAALAGMNMVIVYVMVVISCTLSSLFFYTLGYRASKKIALSFVNEQHYEKFIELFKKRGKIAVLIAALGPLPYLPIIPGILKMNISDFLIYGVAMRIIVYAIVTIVLVLIF